ncbi:Piwi domain-containing protein [Prolixibacteraceae bacterium Z1-6]|uniref:Protein argonaute n=1 Tax=Draconibacterium aestuarii TaxID=2998507 RepID=A0A9X3J8U8_9BACT|nr:Piwi domain-containing protein [Prolixibacteraceae bacterium Z1-6]
MEQCLKLNVLSFEPEKTLLNFSFFIEPQPDSRSLALNKAPIELKDAIPEDSEIEKLYTNFEYSDEADYQVEVDLTRSTNFAKHYYSHLIRQYFNGKVDLINPNFINDIEVWIHESSFSTKQFNAYRVYSIRVQIAKITRNPELLLYYKGKSKILTSTITELWDINHDIYTRVIYNNQFYLFNGEDADLPEEARYNLQDVYPVVNKDLELHFKLSESTNPFANKYTDHFLLLNNFIYKYFDNQEFKSITPLVSTEFIEAPEGTVLYTRKKSNYIQLGLDNKVNVFTPKQNLKEYGPFQLPKNTNIKFIVIYHKDDGDYANQLYMYMKKLYKKSDGKTMLDRYGTSLYDYIRINFDLDKDHSIKYSDEISPIEALHNFLDDTDIDTERFQYVAVYLSRYNKLEADTEKKKIYYRVKELLLEYEITSQVIYRELLYDKKFKSYYYANIAAAILAKVGGIPWKLESEPKDELVVGVGAFKSNEFGVQYIGNAFSFSNNGEFQEFDCASKSKSYLLAAKIKVYVQDFIKKKKNLNRVIIHFYKEMSYEEIKPIKDALFQLGFDDIPIFIININKTSSKDYIAFDTNSKELIPYSGTILNFAPNKYLLFNNTRYFNAENAKVESYHFPIKLSFQCTKPELLKDKSTIKEMIDQVYQFSRMYWKSVKQQNMPVTVKYPELVAKMFPYFKNNDIPDFGKTNLWFL